MRFVLKKTFNKKVDIDVSEIIAKYCRQIFWAERIFMESQKAANGIPAPPNHTRM